MLCERSRALTATQVAQVDYHFSFSIALLDSHGNFQRDLGTEQLQYSCWYQCNERAQALSSCRIGTVWSHFTTRGTAMNCQLSLLMCLQVPGGEQEQTQASSSEAGGTGKGKNLLAMMETMMKDPASQETLYQYLPEGMRNPQTFEYMLNDPVYRSQLETVLDQQVCTVRMCCTIAELSHELHAKIYVLLHGRVGKTLQSFLWQHPFLLQGYVCLSVRLDKVTGSPMKAIIGSIC